MTCRISKEESFNTITHGIGIVLAAIGFLMLLLNSDNNHLLSVVIYGTSLTFLYLASTLYHAITHQKIKNVFRKLDHIGIFLLIGGTYTPFCLVALNGQRGYTILAIVWLLALSGIILKIFLTGKFEIVSLLLYLALGWLVIFVIKPVYESLPLASFVCLMIGGLFYSSGVIFYTMTKYRYHHGIWHLFVLAGSVSHFISIFYLTSN